MDRRTSKRARLVESEDEYDYAEGSSTQVSSSQRSTQRFIGTDLDLDWNKEEMDRKVKDFVRYALACQFKKKTFRRDDINKKILLDMSRSFSKVLEGAKTKLRTVFGMDIIELPIIKDKPGRQTGTQTKSGSSGIYMVRSHMKEVYILPHIIERSKEEYENAGVLYVILGLIFVNEKQMSSSELYSHLDRLHVTKHSVQFGEREKLLDSYIKGGYLKKYKLCGEEGEEVEYNYVWGPKAVIEVPIQNIVEFITDFYQMEDTEKPTFQKKIYRSAGYQIE